MVTHIRQGWRAEAVWVIEIKGLCERGSNGARQRGTRW